MKPSVNARVMETLINTSVDGVGQVVRLTLNVEGDNWKSYRDAGLNIELEDGSTTSAPVWVEEAYAVPFDNSFDIRLLVACPEQGASPFQKKAVELVAGDVVKVSEPLSYPYHAPINSRGKLILLAAGCDVDVFRPLVKKIYERDIDWMGEVRAYSGDVTGIEHVYLNNKNSDAMHYLDDLGFRAFDALMARSSATVARLHGMTEEQAVIEFVRFIRSPSTYVYVAGSEAVVEKLGETVDERLGQPGAWQRIRDELRTQNHWYSHLQ
ncbi:hypothetical protein [Solemya velum gill symbiont]|uniref:Oxidoreductase FAD/NAD(P)-binding domain-containing protein n=1 Tax=Solemya velum gill symbiont TaxID=2340 RepID=A0A0B0H5M2_SOVGS|nr:hypothetical protein [Solemya velum gill symbiont]KHF25508.1 oxidoreductase FAD/NAD(P)-binding domain-containing protein [Solemya velum gill symbiont]OOY35340.1 hypothetical protein BOV88_05245 [Solemya velum gill symbiont]OOY38069.1 hypothetical protein BOV89_04305 [Solemya velum gill symbiont]OOY41066.1 hypothetical protein BOV90_00915 [Solemya velum gill symbiont]OOY42597.1 hypothetical protein BOV91_06495 [Solemya velum gill symbiont]